MTLDQRIAGVAQTCLQYQIEIDALISNGMDRNLPQNMRHGNPGDSEPEHSHDSLDDLNIEGSYASSDDGNNSDSSRSSGEVSKKSPESRHKISRKGSSKDLELHL